MKKVIIEKDTKISKSVALCKGDMLIETALGWLLVEAEDDEEDKAEDDAEDKEDMKEEDESDDKEDDKKEEDEESDDDKMAALRAKKDESKKHR